MAKIPPVSTRRLAQLAGVSHVTVARVLRNDPCVAPATAARVQALVKAHDYRPNPMVSALMAQLRTSRSKSYQPTVAFLNAWWPPQVWRRCPTKTAHFEGARARAHELGYKLEMFWIYAPGMTPERTAEVLRARRIQGVLVGPVQRSWEKISFPWDEFSLGTISFSLRDPMLNNVGSAVFNGMSRIMAELLSRGYRRIGYVTSRDFERRVSTLAGGAFRLYQHEVPPADRIEPLVFENTPDAEGIRRWLATAKPQAVVTRLQDVYGQILSLGVRLPRDLGFAHLDLSPTLKAAGIGGYDQLHGMVGANAVEMVINQIHNNVRGLPRVPVTQFVYGDFVPGKSLRPRRRPADAAAEASPAVFVDRNRFD